MRRTIGRSLQIEVFKEEARYTRGYSDQAEREDGYQGPFLTAWKVYIGQEEERQNEDWAFHH